MKNTVIFFLSMIITSSLAFAGGVEVGDKADGFNLKNVDGKMVSLADYQEAKGFIVIFTCNHCPYSKLYEDRIIALDAIYSDKGFPVIAINPNDPAIQPEDSYPLMQERAKEKGFTFPYLFDETQEVARAYGASRTPHVFILSKEGGDLIVKYIGAIDNNSKNAADASEKYVENALNALLSGNDPEVNYTKAVGCTIKWKAD
jgi:peroxiredoxin